MVASGIHSLDGRFEKKSSEMKCRRYMLKNEKGREKV